VDQSVTVGLCPTPYVPFLSVEAVAIELTLTAYSQITDEVHADSIWPLNWDVKVSLKYYTD
jgi:hypothetical protein